QTTGELQDRPGTSIFQTMFCVGPHASGNDGWSAATPPSPPRNRGQLSSAETTASPSATPQSAPVTRALTAGIVRVSCAAIGKPSMHTAAVRGSDGSRCDGPVRRCDGLGRRSGGLRIPGPSQWTFAPSCPRPVAPYVFSYLPLQENVQLY